MKRLFSDSVIYGASGVLSRMINIFLLPLYSKSFTVSEYGVLAILVVVTSILSQLAILQFSSGAFRFVNLKSSHQNKTTTYSTWFWTQLLISILFLLITYLFSTKLSMFLFSTGNYSTLLTLAVASIPLSTFESVCMTNWRIHSKKWHVTAVNIVGVLIQIFLNYYFIKYLNWGIFSIVWSTLIVSMLKAIVSFVYLFDFIKITAFSKKHFLELYRYSAPFIPAGISIWVVTFFDRILLEKLSGTYEVGIYQMGNTISGFILIPISGFLFAWSPYVFSILDLPKHKEQIARIVEVFTIGTALVGFLCSLFASEILYLFTDPKFYESNIIIPILIFSNISMGLYQLSGIGCAIVKKTTPIMWATITSSIINIVLNIILIPQLNAFGAAIATLISYSIIPLYLFVKAQKVYKLPYNFKVILFSYLVFLFLAIICNYSLQNFIFETQMFLIKFGVTLLVLVISMKVFLKQVKSLLAFK